MTRALASCGRPADYQSATQQTASLRYGPPRKRHPETKTRNDTDDPLPLDFSESQDQVSFTAPARRLYLMIVLGEHAPAQ